MSTSSPLSPNAPFDDDPKGGSTPGPQLSSFPTRTVAIIKTHALVHRFDIERRIQEASFEIVKERQMEIDVEEEPDFLYELFGEDAPSFAEGPVWVYVLERRRAVEVLNTLMGDRDPGVAQREAPNSLRALYGLSLEQNGLMGSPDPQTAEIQIASLFASSPPFPTSELPDDKYGSMRSDVSSSYLSALRRTTSDEGYAPSNVTNPSTVGGGSNGRLNTNGNPHFRARAIPSTHINPDIQPRTTRAAALRAGVVIDKTTSTPRAPLSKERLAKTFANVPGHKRAESIAVASTAAPVIAPRMTRAAALRLGKEAAPTPTTKRIASSKNTKNTFDGVPGHKRSETISVASVLAPTVAPRLNKSASLRARGEAAPPTSFMFRTATTVKLPGLSRSSSQDTLSPRRPQTARPASQASSSRPAVARPSSATLVRPSQALKPTNGTANGTNNRTSTTGPPVAKPKPRPSSVSAPSIAPRTNRSAALRAAKQELENAAAAAAARKNSRGKPPAQRALMA